MKRTIIIFIILISCFSNLKSQISFSCSYRQYCIWNDINQQLEECQGYEESSLFVMNEAETMFTHTIETMKSTYYVTSSEYDTKKDIYTYDVISDVGNKYYYIFDPKNMQVRAVYTKNDNTYLLIFTVKAIF